MSDEMKPCPFCGSAAELYASGRIYPHVVCTSEACKACGPALYSDEAAIESWNTRAAFADCEPEAWRITYKTQDGTRVTYCGHNAIADYRDIDPSAVSVPLYAAASAVETGSRAENPSISVRAAKECTFDAFRHEGDPLFVTQKQLCDEWLENLSKAEIAKANAQQAAKGGAK